MTRKLSLATAACLATTAAMLFLATIPSAAQTQPTLATESMDGEVLTSGPMHEAFAKALPANPEPGMVVPHQPPEPIEELPPDQRPEEEYAVWIPGYWGWDESQEGFVWISGVWRLPPPGAEWVPGYWAKTENGYQWIAGYWWHQETPVTAEAAAPEVVYLPEPPATLETGPTSPLPSDNHFWIPGCWTWREVRYVWRPGYWAAGVPDWVWIPDHYVWSPSGCIFVPGHWDYTLAGRGLLFAPVYFDRVVYTRPAFRYVPTVVINTAVLQTSLFVRPRYCHYYFGDYYAPSFRDSGIVAWFSFHSERRGYDPLFAYHYWHHGRDRTWLASLRQTHEHRISHAESRPPRTYHEMHRRMERHPSEKNVRLAAKLHDIDEIKDLPVRLKPMDEQRRQRYVKLKDEMREFTRQRADVERELHERTPEHRAEDGRPGSRVAEERKPQRVKLPESPMAHYRRDRGTSDMTGRRERAGHGDRETARPELAGESSSQAEVQARKEQPGPGRRELARPDISVSPETAAERWRRDRERPAGAGREPESRPDALGMERTGRGDRSGRSPELRGAPSLQPSAAPQQPDATQPGRESGRMPGADRGREIQPTPPLQGTEDPFGERFRRGRDRDPSLQRMPQPGTAVRQPESPSGLERLQPPSTRQPESGPRLSLPGMQDSSPDRALNRGAEGLRDAATAPRAMPSPRLDWSRPDAQSPRPGRSGLETGRRERTSGSQPDFRNRLDAIQQRQPPMQMPDVSRTPASSRSGSIPGLERSPHTFRGSASRDGEGSSERSTRSRASKEHSAAKRMGRSAVERLERSRPAETGRRERTGRSDRDRGRGN